RIPHAAELPVRGPEPARDVRAGPAPLVGVRRARRHALDARVRALGRQPAEGRPRARDRQQPEGADRGAADAGARRRRDRVRAPPARRAARHRPGGAARVARAGGDPVAVRPHPRHLRGPDRGRVPAERDGGGARVRDDGRPAGGCSGMTDESLLAEEAAAAPPPETPQPSQSFPSRFGGLTGAIGPVITTLIAFLMGGLVVLATGKNPFKVYHAIFNGTGLNWFFHVGSHTARIPFTTHKVWFPWDTA